MINEPLTDSVYERASLARDMLYMTENAKDMQVSEAMLFLDAIYDGKKCFLESDIVSYAEEVEIEQAIADVDIPNDEINEEIESIITTDKPILTIDEVLGISDNVVEPNSGISIDEVVDALNDDED